MSSQFEEFLNGDHFKRIITDSFLEAEESLLPSLSGSQGTYSDKKTPKLTEELLSDLAELCDLLKRPKVPKRVYYIESKYIPVNIMYRFSPGYTSLYREVITFHPHSANLFLQAFRSLGIIITPYFNLFPWCESYRAGHHKPQENYDEFWNDLKSKIEATIQINNEKY